MCCYLLKHLKLLKRLKLLKLLKWCAGTLYRTLQAICTEGDSERSLTSSYGLKTSDFIETHISSLFSSQSHLFSTIVLYGLL